MAQSRRWCWTSFDTTLAAALQSKEVKSGPRPQMKFLVFQEETCPETQRPHLQGYTEFTTGVRRAAFQRWLGDNVAHCDAAKGSGPENVTYCTKEDSRRAGPWTLGEVGGQGQRTDLQGLQDALQEGATNRQLWETQFPTMVRYHRAVAAYRFETAVGETRDPPEVHVYHGPTGTGKTRRVHHAAGNALYTVDVADRGKQPWFDGYNGQECVLLDDYNGEYNVNFLKRLLDRYPMTVQVKGGYTHWRPKKIYITSNTAPDSWYAGSVAVDQAAIMRRITTITHVTELDEAQFQE